MDETTRTTSHHLQWLFFAVWAAMVLWLIAHHAIWADEARAWLIATRTETWSKMFQQTHADGHPVLWYVFLRLGAAFLGAAFHDSLTSFYAIHFVFAALAAGFCLSLTRLSLTLRLALLFGGILGHEFAVVGRNYAPAIAALFAFAYFYPVRNTHPLRAGMLIAFALNVHAGLAPIVPFLMLPWLIEAWRGERKPFLIAAGMVAGGYAVLMLSIFPPIPDSIFINSTRIPVSRFAEFLPSHQLIPIVTVGFADILDLDDFFSIRLCVLISVVFCGLVFFLFQSTVFRVAALGIVVATSLFYAVTYPMLSYRHSALLIISLCCLLAMEPVRGPETFTRRIADGLFNALVLLQLVRIVAVMTVPFSTSHLVRSFLERPDYREARVLCLPDWMGQTIAAQGFADCTMTFVDREGPFPLFLLRDYQKPTLRLRDLTHWMVQEEAQGRPGLVYMHILFMPTTPQEPAEFGQSHRRGRRFTLRATQAEALDFLSQIEELTPRVYTLSPENGILLRLKPEYRDAHAPSDAPRTDP